MDTSSHLFLGAFLLLACSSQTVSSLYCYDCSYNKLETETSVVSWFLDALSKLSDEHCLLRQESDRNQAKQRECPEPESGKVAKCVVINGTATTKIEFAGVEISTVVYKSLVRNCIEVDPDDSEYSNGCHDDLPSTAASVFDSAFNSIDLGDLEFKGQACYADDKHRYESTNGATYTGGALVVVMTSWAVAYLGCN